MSEKFNVKTVKLWGTQTVELEMNIGLYAVCDFMGQELPGLAITLANLHPTKDMPADFGVLTVSFGEYISLKNSFYVDTNNCPFYQQLLTEDIAINTGLTKRSGFCEYPLYRFTPEFIEKLKAAGGINAHQYDEYEKAVDSYNPMGWMAGEDDEDEDE